jgi:hypothetical protein
LLTVPPEDENAYRSPTFYERKYGIFNFPLL